MAPKPFGKYLFVAFSIRMIVLNDKMLQENIEKVRLNGVRSHGFPCC
ncbi:hypothetical protein ACFFOO_15880 [Mucilaginibacter ginsenosidivorans]